MTYCLNICFNGEAYNINLITFIPCHLEMALSGLKALKVLNDLNAVKLALPSTAKLRIETFKMKKKTYLTFNV